MKTVVAAALLAGVADAYWRMPCEGRLGYARIDPLLNPGQASPHAHSLFGGSSLGIDTKTSADLEASKCTSCSVEADKSGYWAPGLLFQHDNGTMELVEQDGGMIVYYQFGDDGNFTAFPPDFQMIAGNTSLRSSYEERTEKAKSNILRNEEADNQELLRQQAIGFNCLSYFTGRENEATAGRNKMPAKDFMDQSCTDGLRAEIFFPSCWDGKNERSDSHQSHVKYPVDIKGGKCPQGFETRLPVLLFESKWRTDHYKGIGGRFIWSNGDTSGYGYHADFINGWNQPTLELAVQKDQCGGRDGPDFGRIEACPVFNGQSVDNAATSILSMEEMQKCYQSLPDQLKGEDCTGSSATICGNVTITQDDGTLPGGGPGAPAAVDAGPQASREASSPSATPSSFLSSMSTPAPMAPSTQEIRPASLISVPTTVSSVPSVAAPLPTQSPAVPKNIRVKTVFRVETVTKYTTVIEDAPQRLARRHSHKDVHMRGLHHHHHI